jgi:hypothetical protein
MPPLIKQRPDPFGPASTSNHPRCESTGKTVYPTFNSAERGRKQMRKMRDNHDTNPGVRLHAYLCPHCKGFHVGHTFTNRNTRLAVEKPAHKNKAWRHWSDFNNDD